MNDQAGGRARLGDLVDTSAAVGATRSRLAKRSAIAGLLRDCHPDDVAIVVTYLSGALRQRRTGVGWGSLQDAPPGADSSSLTVTEVDAAFETMSGLAGAGSQDRRRSVLAELLGRATPTEQSFLRRLIAGELRQGALDGVMMDAVAESFDVAPAAVRRASMLLGSTAAAARIAAADGEAGLAAVGLVVGQPIRPMLAATSSDVAAALSKVGADAIVDRKLDGIRIQVHRRDDDIAVYTRSLDDITARMPETVEVVRTLPATQLILDGEALVLDSGGRPRPFQMTAARTASRVDMAALVSSAPVSTYFFDLLHRDGEDLLDRPLAERLAALETLVPEVHRVPGLQTTDVGQAEEFLSESIAIGHEGVVIKSLEAPYEAGRRGSSWVKVKPRHTLDLVVLAAEWGHGRRQGWLSNLHLGARGADDEFVMLGKTFKGMTDELLGWQTEQLLAREVRRTQGTVYVRPELVVEIAFDGVQTSTRYPGGVTLRFARVLRYRDDKTAAEADTVASVRTIGGMEPETPT
ncbi:MAG: ATP-dependent DNA ligase [Nocardioidaceae bacterium]